MLKLPRSIYWLIYKTITLKLTGLAILKFFCRILYTIRLHGFQLNDLLHPGKDLNWLIKPLKKIVQKKPCKLIACSCLAPCEYYMYMSVYTDVVWDSQCEQTCTIT